jgi:hypothetical protein
MQEELKQSDEDDEKASKYDEISQI